MVTNNNNNNDINIYYVCYSIILYLLNVCYKVYFSTI